MLLRLYQGGSLPEYSKNNLTAICWHFQGVVVMKDNQRRLLYYFAIIISWPQIKGHIHSFSHSIICIKVLLHNCLIPAIPDKECINTNQTTVLCVNMIEKIVFSSTDLMPFMLRFLKFRKLCHQGFWQRKKILPIKIEDFLVCPQLFTSLSSLLSSLIQESATHSAYGQKFSGGMSHGWSISFLTTWGKSGLHCHHAHKNSGIYFTKSSLRADRPASAVSLFPWRKRQKK